MASFKPQNIMTLMTFIVLLALPIASAHNITRLLSQYPEFSTFNDLLNRTKLNLEINRRQTITVLAVENSIASRLAGLPQETLKNILSIHVILDYYDFAKFRAIRRRSVSLTTLYQTTGVANNGMGFLNLTKLPSNMVAFGSALPGSPLVATYIKPVGARPYNLSVLQISGVIVPAGIDDEAVVAGVRSPPLPSNYFLAPPAPVVSNTAEGPEAESPETTEAEAPSEETDNAPAPGPGPMDKSVKVSDDGDASGVERPAGIAGVGIVMFIVGAFLSF